MPCASGENVDVVGDIDSLKERNSASEQFYVNTKLIISFLFYNYFFQYYKYYLGKTYVNFHQQSQFHENFAIWSLNKCFS